MSTAKLRLLLLSVGSLAAQNVIDALGARRGRCVLIGTNSVAEAAGNFRCDTAYLVPPAAAGAAYIERVADVIREEQPDLVIPCRDDDILALATLAEQSARTHPVLLAGSVAAARIMNDKLETARFAGRHGLPFAPTASNVREALAFAESYRLPLIGKPRYGNASIGVVLLRSIGEVERAFALRPDLLAQPYLDPPANMDALVAPFETGLPFFFSFPEKGLYLAQLVVGPDGAISDLFGGVAIQVGGQSTQIARCDDPDLFEVGRAYAQAAAAEGWKGPLNVQLKRTAEGRLVAYELNGRFTGGTAARTLLGFDEVAEVIGRFLPGTAFPSIPASESNVVQNYRSSYPVPRAGVATLGILGRWSSEVGDAPPKPAETRRIQGKLRLLLLSVGALSSQRFIDALGDRREHCVLIGTNSVANAAGNFRCDIAYLVPPAASGAAYVKRIAELIEQERPDLVIPSRDDDVLALATLGEQSPPGDVVLLTGSVAAARIMNDKVETARFAVRHGLPFAPTATNVREALDLARAHRLPLIGKPRYGNASIGVVLLRSTAEIERAYALRPDMIAQAYLDPPADMDGLIAPFETGLPFFFSFPATGVHGLQVIVCPDGTLLQPVATVSTQIGGAAVDARRCDEPQLVEIGRAYGMAAATEGWRGPINVQLKRTSENRFVAFELNGRFTGTMGERVFMGSDEIARVMGRFLPKAAFPSISESGSDIVQRYLHSYPVSRRALAALQTSGKWSRE